MAKASNFCRWWLLQEDNHPVYKGGTSVLFPVIDSYFPDFDKQGLGQGVTSSLGAPAIACGILQDSVLMISMVSGDAPVALY